MLDKNKKLKQSFDDYGSMQDRHIQSHTNELRPDLSKHNFERSKYFENLKNDLTNMLFIINNHDQDAESLRIAQDCREKIESILAHDKILIEHLQNYRLKLSQHLKKMGHGKKALTGYLQNSKTNEDPRFMDKSG